MLKALLIHVAFVLTISLANVKATKTHDKVIGPDWNSPAIVSFDYEDDEVKTRRDSNQ